MGSNIIIVTQGKRKCEQFDDKWEEAAWWTKNSIRVTEKLKVARLGYVFGEEK